MYEIGVAAQFEAAHRLTGDFGPATRMHGHTYRLEVIVRGTRLDTNGVLFNIGELRSAVDGLAASLDYRDLGEVPMLAGVNTTVDTVASYCWDTLSPRLHHRGLASLLVRVWESPQVHAAREDDLTP